MLDYESEKKAYMVTVTASDKRGPQFLHRRDHQVTPVDEAPEIMTGRSSTEYPENGTGAGSDVHGGGP